MTRWSTHAARPRPVCTADGHRAFDRIPMTWESRSSCRISGTLSCVVKNGNDVKTVQELLRHASARITLEIYAQALGETKREAQGQVYRVLLDAGLKSLVLPSVTTPQITSRSK
jgi:hypothetical protein